MYYEILFRYFKFLSLKMFAVLILSALFQCFVNSKSIPFKNIQRYAVRGTLNLPYTEISGKSLFCLHNKI